MIKKFQNHAFALISAVALAACAAPPPRSATPLPAAPTPAPTPEPTVLNQPVPIEPITTTLKGQAWQWVSFTSPVEQFDVAGPEHYEVTFNDDGTANIKADCNRARATYATVEDNADGGQISIEMGPATLALCPSGSRSEQFVKLLGSAARYFFQDGDLLIDLKADGGTLRFATADSLNVSPPAQAIRDTLTAFPWEWSRALGTQDPIQITAPELYRVIFDKDGSVTIKADCNTATGAYTVEGSNLSIKIGPATLAACPPGSLSEQFLKLLGSSATFALVGSQLFVNLADNGGLMFLDSAPPTAVDICGDKALAINTIESTLAPTITAQLDEALVSLLRGPRAAPGVSFLVITPQGRYFKSTGVSDVKTCAPLIADISYQIGSNTKMMTAAMIFQLQEEGKLATTDLLSKWLPDLAAKIPNGDVITLDMLLTHTSGIYDYINGVNDDGPLSELVRSRDLLVKSFTPEELVQLAIDYGRPTSAPGAEFHYSNTGYVLLGLIIEKATGKTYEENLQTRIFEPLGLKNTYLQAGQRKPLALPQGYLHPPFDYTAGEWNASQGWAAGAVVSTAEDFAVFLKALFTGKLFKDATMLELMQAHTDAGVGALGPGTVYAHGMTNNNGVLGHGGQTPGFQSDGGYVPGDDVTIVFWANSSENNASRILVPGIAQLVGAKTQTQ